MTTLHGCNRLLATKTVFAIEKPDHFTHFQHFAECAEQDLFHACSRSQRQFVAAFLEYLIATYAGQLPSRGCDDDVLWV